MKRDGGKKVLIYNIPIERQLNILKVLNNIKILDKNFCRYKELSVFEREHEILLDDIFDIGILNVTDFKIEVIENIIKNDISKMFCIYYSESDNIEYLNENVKLKVLNSLDNIDEIRDIIINNIKITDNKYVVNEDVIGKVNFNEFFKNAIEEINLGL